VADDDFTFGNAAENPDLLAAAQAVSAEAQAPALPDPLDGPVTLPAGVRAFADGKFDEIRKAWVRELNGEDEERIARAKMRNDVNSFVEAILEAGVERLGDSRPAKDDLDALVLGDRDFLLLEIARVTYGDTLDFNQLLCDHCGENFDVSISLSEDIPVKRLDKVSDGVFEVPLSKDRIASVRLPTGEVGREVAKAETEAEANTALIAFSVQEIRGGKNGPVQIAGDVDAARKLGVRDRQALVNEMSKRMPGPQYNEVKFKHEPGCGGDIRLLVTMADLFRGL
jgi:hypothetical protein